MVGGGHRRGSLSVPLPVFSFGKRREWLGGGVQLELRLLGAGLPVFQFIEIHFDCILTIFQIICMRFRQSIIVTP